MIEEAELTGYLNLTGQKVSFLVPVFQSHRRLCTQETTDRDRVKTFVPMSDVMRRHVIAARETKTVRPGDPAVFAFQLPDGDIVSGTKREVVRSLRSRRRMLAPFPFASLAVARFTNDVRFGRSQVFKSAQQLERKDRHIGQKWLETELRSLEPDIRSTNRTIFTRGEDQQGVLADIRARITAGADVYVRLQLSGSSAGLKPKVRNLLTSLQLEDARIGTETKFQPITLRTLQNLRQVSHLVRITEILELPRVGDSRSARTA